MTPGGIAAALTIAALLITTLVSVWQWRHALTKEKTNRLIMLERWADAIQRYIRQLRDYLIGQIRKGMDCPHCGKHLNNVIDGSQLDMSKFPAPPMPTINGNGS